MAAEILSAAEAERLAQSIQTFELHQVGSRAWLEQHKVGLTSRSALFPQLTRRPVKICVPFFALNQM